MKGYNALEGCKALAACKALNACKTTLRRCVMKEPTKLLRSESLFVVMVKLVGQVSKRSIETSLLSWIS